MHDHEQSKNPNRLSDEKSPYLLQHAYNPVNWYPWTEEAFSKARQKNLPIFLSIGYSACHWCHVMERESFESMEVAQLLNEHFISIKVDREEMPDVDHMYMEACMALTGAGGWPLSCFLTYDKKPFYAGTYFPKDKFLAVLHTIAEQWQNNKSNVILVSERIIKHISPQEAQGGEIDPNMIHRVFEGLKSRFDKEYGGFGNAPKFPSAQNILFLLRYYVYTKNEVAGQMVQKTLDAMYQGGIFDHIGGGFCRYSTDTKWLIPHFEKMMVDNAMLIITYIEAGMLIAPHYLKTARLILDYCFAEMYQDGAFFTAQDADSEGVEGKYYLYTPSEIKQILGHADGERFCMMYQITDRGNFEGKSIPNLIGVQEVDEEFAQRCKMTIYEHRKKRISPFRDDKQLTGVNGLMLVALCMAARFIDPLYTQKAEELADFFGDMLTKSERLYVGFRQNLLGSKATLDDYAYVLWGFFELYQTTLEAKWLEKTIFYADKITELFYQNGKLYLTGGDTQSLPVRTKNIYDGALPSGCSITINMFLKLSHVMGDPKYLELVQSVRSGLSKEIHAYPEAFATLMWSEIYRAHGGTQILITDGNGFEDMIKVQSRCNPFMTIKKGDKISGNATAYVCKGKTCLPPITDVQQLMEKVQESD